MVKKNRVAVVYLARKQQGLKHLKEFILSYKKYSAGLEHDLIILCKGFKNKSEIKSAKGFLKVSHQKFWVDDSGFDITAYLKCIHALNYDNFCFFNTYSQICSEKWLKIMMRCKEREGVGIVGAMGSFESISASLFALNKVIWLYQHSDPKKLFQIKKYFNFLIIQNFSSEVIHKTETLDKNIFGSILNIIRFLHTKNIDYWNTKNFDNHWKSMTKIGGPLFEHGQFPRFPNPHIRSNAFVVSKKLMLEFTTEGIKTKMDACRFESGQSSLTAKVFQRGQKAYVVNSDGNEFEYADWPASQTFRAGGQKKLLVTDNQTRTYDSMSREEQATHSWLSWGVFDPNMHPNFTQLNSEICKISL